jgi:hypothetical protein
MSYESVEHQIKQCIQERDAGYGYWYLPGCEFDSCLKLAYFAGQCEGATVCQRQVKETFDKSVLGCTIAELTWENDKLRDTIADLQCELRSAETARLTTIKHIKA